MTRKEDYTSLMRGLQELDFNLKHIPSDLMLTGDDAFPLAMNPRGQVLMAASRYGKGRVVVLGHEEYLTAFPKLVENALLWLTSSAKTPALVGIQQNCSIANVGIDTTEVGNFQSKFSAYICDAYNVNECAKKMVAHLKAGGGLLIAGQAWSWAKDNPKLSPLRHFPGNKVCSVAGIYFSEHEGELGKFQVPQQIPSNWLSVSIGKNFEDDLEFLEKGVSEFDIKGGALLSGIFVHGPLAFPIATTPDKRAFIAGAYYGQGRVIVLTHESFLGRAKLSTFMTNAIHWLDEGRNGVVGILPKLKAAYNLLKKSGLKCKKTSFKEGLSVYVCNSYSSKNCKEIQDFVAEGGGLMIAGHAWHWASTHKGGNVMTDYPGNKIINKMGLCTMGDTIKGGLYKVPEVKQACAEAYHFRGLLHRFAEHAVSGEKLTKPELESLPKLGNDCTTYLRMGSDCGSYASVLASITDLVKKAGVPQVCAKNPIKSQRDHLMLTLGTELHRVCPNPDELLPYIIKQRPNMRTVHNTKISFSAKTHGGEEWISTGLYLAPGMKTYMSMPTEMIGKGWKVQIGCQTDRIKGKALKRPPVVYRRVPVKKGMMLVSNLWGGLIYFIAPPKTSVENIEVVVQMAIQAPYYKSGETSVEDWVGGIRRAPAPWAELEFENLIITLRSGLVRKLDRPDEVAKLWDAIMRGVADLAAKSAKFPRKERFVADVQISHGFMHAGYPIMMDCSAAPCLLKPELARKKGLWGAIHELGHNQQRKCWEFPPNTTECTCNLWSVYVHEEVLGVKRANAHQAMVLSKRQGRAKKYAKGRGKLKGWSMWVALETYMQLQDEFGWDAFKKVHAAYHKMRGIPKNNKGRMNLYAETFSNVVKKNLVPFFKAWGWPIESSTDQKLSGLPEWSDHPMAKYIKKQ